MVWLSAWFVLCRLFFLSSTHKNLLSREYACAEAACAPIEAPSACRTMLRCDLPRNKKYECVRGAALLTADLTCVALASAGAHFDIPTADGPEHTTHEANRGCLRVPKLAIHTRA